MIKQFSILKITMNVTSSSTDYPCNKNVNTLVCLTDWTKNYWWVFWYIIWQLLTVFVHWSTTEKSSALLGNVLCNFLNRIN